MNKDLFRTYQTACLVGPMLPLLGETLDQFEGNSVITTYAPELRPSSPWRKQIVEGWTIISVDLWKPHNVRCILDREGNVNFYTDVYKRDSQLEAALTAKN